MSPLVITLVILLVVFVALLSGKYANGVGGGTVIVALMVFGILTPAEALSGFSNTNVVIMFCMMVLSAGLMKTNIIHNIVKLVNKVGHSERALVAGADRIPVDVTAVGETEALFFEAGRIVRTCADACEFHHRLVMNLLRVVAAKNLTMNRKLEITARRTTREKLLTYLELQAKQAGSAEFTIPFDRQALADYLEVDRSGLSAEIGRLRREGVLRSEKNRFTLLVPKQTE